MGCLEKGKQESISNTCYWSNYDRSNGRILLWLDNREVLVMTKCPKCNDTGERKHHLFGTWPCDCLIGLKKQFPGAEILTWDELFEALSNGGHGSFYKKIDALYFHKPDHYLILLPRVIPDGEEGE